jgi:hypothetical protein
MSHYSPLSITPFLLFDQLLYWELWVFLKKVGVFINSNKNHNSLILFYEIKLLCPHSNEVIAEIN